MLNAAQTAYLHGYLDARAQQKEASSIETLLQKAMATEGGRTHVGRLLERAPHGGVSRTEYVQMLEDKLRRAGGR